MIGKMMEENKIKEKTGGEYGAEIGAVEVEAETGTGTAGAAGTAGVLESLEQQMFTQSERGVNWIYSDEQ